MGSWLVACYLPESRVLLARVIASNQGVCRMAYRYKVRRVAAMRPPVRQIAPVLREWISGELGSLGNAMKSKTADQAALHFRPRL